MNAAEIVTFRSDARACARVLARGSKSFALASRLFPRSVAEPAAVFYAWCRAVDDAVDTGGGASALAEQRVRLARIYAGRPRWDAVDRGLARVVSTWDVPRGLLEGLLEGMSWDVDGRRYRTLSGVEAYAARVAGAVGGVMSVLMGRREPEVLARAFDLGIAMQLTNIARDVAEDARIGRVYLPREWLDDAGIAPSALASMTHATPELRAVVSRLLDAAETRYRAAEPGIRALPARCRPAVRAAALIYREIGARVRDPAFDPILHRAVVGTPRKLALLARALLWRGPTQEPRLPRESFFGVLDAGAARAA